MTEDGRSTDDRRFDYDVALSFSDDDRAYVSEVAELLRQEGVRVFYDGFAQAKMWGADLTEYLDDIYRKRSRYTMVFISESYVTKPWTTLERRSALARALEEISPYLLPVRLDDSELPGLRPSVGFVDARKTSPVELVDLTRRLLAEAPARSGASPTSSRASIGVPRSEAQRRRLLEERPPAWEYLLFASHLAGEKERLEPKWRDHQLRHRQITGIHLDDRGALHFLSNSISEFSLYVANLEGVFSERAQEAAFGPEGVPGDPAAIQHLAFRLMSAYESCLDWAARVRGAGVSSLMARLLELTAAYPDSSIISMRNFVDQNVANADSTPAKLAAPHKGPVVIVTKLKLDIDPRVMRDVNRELKAVQKRIRF